MIRIAKLAGVLSLAVSVWAIALSEARAQQPYDYESVVYEAARNKIGLMHYCRDNALLNAGIADKAAEALRSGLLKMAAASALAQDKGDIAEDAGEDGFWEANRRRDMASIAKQFGGTPAELCSEWARETLRMHQPDGPPDAIPVVSVKPLIASPPALPSPRTVDRRRVLKSRQLRKAVNKAPAPAKAVAVAAKTAVPHVATTPVVAKREEPTANWATGPITVWTRVRVQVRPARERTSTTVAQNRERD